MCSLWTDRELDILRAMWADGKSGGEIARELRRTRNAVLGKIDRLGLTRERQGKREARPPKPARVRPVPLLIPAKAAACDTKRPPRVVEPPAELQPSRNLTIFDLTRIDCRAITSPDRAAVTLYCGHTVRPGSAYCPAHHARFHVKGADNAKPNQADRLANHHAQPAEEARRVAGVHAGGAAKPRG